MKNFIHNPKEKRYENQNTESMNIENQEVLNSNLQKYENQTSANMKIEIQEVPKSYSNNTNNNYTDFNDTEKNNTESSDTEIISYPNGKNGKRENLSETRESFTYPAGDTSCKDDE